MPEDFEFDEEEIPFDSKEINGTKVFSSTYSSLFEVEGKPFAFFKEWNNFYDLSDMEFPRDKNDEIDFNALGKDWDPSIKFFKKDEMKEIEPSHIKEKLGWSKKDFDEFLKLHFTPAPRRQILEDLYPED